MFTETHVEMQHGVFRPFRFQPFHGQTFEQVPPSLEIRTERAGEQRLAETPGTAQEHVFGGGMRHAVDVFRLVDIQVILVDDFREGLYPDGIESGGVCHKRFLPVMIVQQQN